MVAFTHNFNAAEVETGGYLGLTDWSGQPTQISGQ